MIHQQTLDEVRRARASDAETSKAAARQAGSLVADHRRAILAIMSQGGAWSAHEIAERCGLTSVQVSRRLAAMRDDGIIRRVDQTRKTPSGRDAQCYETTS